MNKELIKELQDNPEKLTEFLKNFDIETLAKSIKRNMLDYCMENTKSRSLLLLFETDEHIVGGIAGDLTNIINTILNVVVDNPELKSLIQMAAMVLEDDKWYKKT